MLFFRETPMLLCDCELSNPRDAVKAYVKEFKGVDNIVTEIKGFTTTHKMPQQYCHKCYVKFRDNKLYAIYASNRTNKIYAQWVGEENGACTILTYKLP